MSEDDNIPSPSSVLAYILDEIVGIKAKLAVLEATFEAQSEALCTLFVALPLSKRPPALAMLQTLKLSLEVNRGESAAALLGAVIERVEALYGEDGSATLENVTAIVSVDAALLRTAPPGQEDAMKSWLNFATEGEIVQEMLQLPPEQLHALLKLNHPSKPAKRGGASKGKKKPGKS